MPVHTTNYANTFIEVADDCKAAEGLPPPEKQAKTIARMQYELIHANPYQYTSDDVVFTVYAERGGIGEADRELKRAELFSKGQPCLRSSPLAKTYGWGIHFDGAGKIALYPRGSADYERLRGDDSLQHLKAMRSAR